MSKHENTVVRAIREGWYIEEIQKLVRNIQAITIHNIARRHGMKARHAPQRPHFMRHKAIYEAVKSCGLDSAATLFQLAISTVRTSCQLYRKMDRQRRPVT